MCTEDYLNFHWLLVKKFQCFFLCVALWNWLLRAQMALASLVPFQGPKKSRFSGPTPSNAPRNDVAPLKTITSRAIKITGTSTLIVTIFLSPAGMSRTKLSLGGNNLYIASLFPPRDSLVSDIPAGGRSTKSFFYGEFWVWTQPESNGQREEGIDEYWSMRQKKIV